MFVAPLGNCTLCRHAQKSSRVIRQHTAVKRILHILDSQGQFLALAFKPSDVFPLCSEADLRSQLRETPNDWRSSAVQVSRSSLAPGGQKSLKPFMLFLFARLLTSAGAWVVAAPTHFPAPDITPANVVPPANVDTSEWLGAIKPCKQAKGVCVSAWRA